MRTSRSMRFSLRGLALVTGLSVLACDMESNPDEPERIVAVQSIGDTSVVRTLSGSVWKGVATLVPELRIGEMEGPEEYLFGSVEAIAVDEEHNVYVLDYQAKHIRVFNASGNYIETLGRGGDGPGELDVPIGLAISRDRVLVRDPANGRVQLFGPGPGQREEWAYEPSGYFMNTPLYTDDQDRVWVDNSNPDLRFLIMDSNGSILDTLTPPNAPDDFNRNDYYVEYRGESPGGQDRLVSAVERVPFSPGWYWEVHSSGHFLSALSTAYTIHLQGDEGVLRIEREHSPIPVAADERRYHRERIENIMRRFDAGWDWNGPDVPSHKPPFKGLDAGTDGRIWVRLWTEGQQVVNEDHDPNDPASVPSYWSEPSRYDVFEADGTYLGAVEVPEGFSMKAPPVFGRSFVWAVERGELDVERVVRYRIDLPG